jgi:pSer/pThr/pTyr-binding forkhead associated (FHA) protein
MDAGGTMVMPALKIPPAPAPPPPAAPAPPPAAPSPLVSDATQMFRPARLVPQNPEAGKTTYTLALKPMSIGSDQHNDIRIGGPGVEPKHAQIAATPQGYVLADFETKHGTRVNAEKVREKLLQHEDIVQVGAARFIFRAN